MSAKMYYWKYSRN